MRVYPVGSTNKLELRPETDCRIDFLTFCLDVCPENAKGALVKYTWKQRALLFSLKTMELFLMPEDFQIFVQMVSATYRVPYIIYAMAEQEGKTPLQD